MEPAASLHEMVEAPVGRYFAPAATALVWCKSPTMGGAVAWGQPTPQDVERVLAAFDGFRSPALSKRVSVVLDGRGIERVDPDGLALLLTWLQTRRGELVERLRVQIGVVDPDTLAGVTLCGILPVVGDMHRFRVMSDARAAYRELSPAGDALAAEVDQLVANARGVPEPVTKLRELLRAHPVGTTLATASVTLGIARRSLQRLLEQCGTTFREELRTARYLRASELLVEGGDKIAVVARRTGLSEGALAQLVREKAGHNPAALRRLARK